MNIQSAIIEGTNILKGKSINSAKLDSEILLASAIDQDRKYIIINNDQNIKEENLTLYNLGEVLEGKLDDMIMPLSADDESKKLSQLSDE